MNPRAALRAGLAPLLAALAWAALLGAPHAETASGPVYLTRLNGMINAGTSAHLTESLEQCRTSACQLLVVELDTPGGDLEATKDMVSAILNAEVPVVVYVSPRGAWAASAGTFITLAGHIAAMAPSTTIGAAHPITSGGGDPGGPMPPPGTEPPAPGAPPAQPQPGWRGNFLGQKVENLVTAFAESIARERGRNVDFAARAVRESIAVGATEAVEKKVVDLVAEDVDGLLKAIDGREVKVNGRPVTLATASAQTQRIEMTWQNRALRYLADPGVAFLLLMAGVFCLYLEFNAPGGFVAGTIGALCLLVAAFAFGMIPFNALGLVLLLLGVALMVAEIFLPTFGIAFGAGAISLAVGAYLLFDVPEIGEMAPPFWTTIFPPVATVILGGALVVYVVSRSIFHPVFAGSGADGLIGQVATVDERIDPGRRGRVRLQGELWNAESGERIEPGERVRIEEVNDLVVRVARIGGENKT